MLVMAAAWRVVSATSSGTAGSLGAVTSSQSYDPWGAMRSSVGKSGTEFNYTGQRKDAGTGLLFYNARYYDPALARFVQADSIVPGGDSKTDEAGHDDTLSLRPLTVDFHETGFVAGLNNEHAFTLEKGFWFQLSDAVKKDQDTKQQWGPQSAQALNRYAYVLNNPLRYTDPTGHESWWQKAKRAVRVMMRSTMPVLKIIKDGAAIITGTTLILTGLTTISIAPFTTIFMPAFLAGGVANLVWGGLGVYHGLTSLPKDWRELINILKQEGVI